VAGWWQLRYACLQLCCRPCWYACLAWRLLPAVAIGRWIKAWVPPSLGGSGHCGASLHADAPTETSGAVSTCVCTPSCMATMFLMFCRYYLSGTDAYRLKLLLPLTPAMLAAHEMQRLAHEQATEQPNPAHQQPAQHGQSAGHAVECDCSHHEAAHGDLADQASAQHSEAAGGDASVANGAQPHASGSADPRTRKPARKPKSRRR